MTLFSGKRDVARLAFAVLVGFYLDQSAQVEPASKLRSTAPVTAGHPRLRRSHGAIP